MSGFEPLTAAGHATVLRIEPGGGSGPIRPKLPGAATAPLWMPVASTAGRTQTQ